MKFGSNIVTNHLVDGVDISVKASQWDNAVSWGNHALAGYSVEGHTHNVVDINDFDANVDSKITSTVDQLFVNALNVSAAVAGQLTTNREFSVSGDAVSSGVAFNGTSNVNLNVTFADDCISTKSLKTTVDGTDLILVSNSAGTQISKLALSVLRSYASGGLIAEAPIDGNAYVRVDGNWVQVANVTLVTGDTYDGKTPADVYDSNNDQTIDGGSPTDTYDSNNDITVDGGSP